MSSVSTARAVGTALMLTGGSVGFSAGGARLYDDLLALRPTFLGVVPRVLDVLHARFGDELLAERRRAPERTVAEIAFAWQTAQSTTWPRHVCKHRARSTANQPRPD